MDRLGNEDSQDEVSAIESLEAGDDDAYEEIMRKRRRMLKRASSQQHPHKELGRHGKEVQMQFFTPISVVPKRLNGGAAKAKLIYTRLYELAIAYLAAPATSASIERFFSPASLAIGGCKKSTLEVLLDMKLVVHINENLSVGINSLASWPDMRIM